jgi:Fe-S-cluster-containing dehydrogenase component/DMSO reductase anchor subunit
VRRAAFLFDLNRCTGCNACQLACTIENGLPLDVSWRSVFTYNAAHHPTLPRFHLSLACNHCAAAPCMAGCPALAYRRDPERGLVQVDATRCIGCRYCTWTCPYDALRYDARHGVVSKCTYCAERLAAGREPACTTGCPTGALRTTTLDDAAPRRAAAPRRVAATGSDPLGHATVPGFPDVGTQPSIRLVPLAPGRCQPATGEEGLAAGPDAPASPPLSLPPATPPSAAPRISARGEWSLVVFTLLAATLVALGGAASPGVARLAAALPGGAGWSSAPPVPGPAGVLALVLVACAASLAHLGRPARAWRAVLGVRRSWLAREVAGFGLFAALLVLTRAASTAAGRDVAGAFTGAGAAVAGSSGRVGALDGEPAALAVVVLGLLVLATIDRVYAVTRGPVPHALHSASVLGTGLFLMAVWIGAASLVLALGVVRGALYLWRQSRRRGAARAAAASSTTAFAGRLTAIRLLGLAVPGLAVGLAPGAAWAPGVALAAAWLGEIADRTAFYDEIEVRTPARTIAARLARDLAGGMPAGR